MDELRAVLTPWKKMEVQIQGADGNLETVEYFKKDTLAVLQEILENPNLADKCVWAPVREFVHRANGVPERLYTDLDNSDWWYEMQVQPVLQVHLTCLIEDCIGKGTTRCKRHSYCLDILF